MLRVRKLNVIIRYGSITMGKRKIVKHYCTDCEQNKAVFDIDKFDNKRCPECGAILIKKVFEL